jgi:hypothetical protein
MRARVLLLLWTFGAAAACGTLGTLRGGDVDLPTSDVGPFRALSSAEVLGAAPLVLDAPAARYREPAILALDPNPASLQVALYAVAARNGADVLVRTRADDARSFYGASLATSGAPEVVLEPDQAWEGEGVHSPALLRSGAEVWLYYAAAGGIGLAVSPDGVHFTKAQSAPVLAPDPAATWETSPPTQPSVALLDDGKLHMLYAAGVSIGEALSADGRVWTRLDGDPTTPALDPVFSPLSFDASSLAPDASPPFDVGQVADPCLLPRDTAAGREQVRVLYTGYDAPPSATPRASAIGFAARYGPSGLLERAPSPVYEVGKHEAAPALFEWSGGAMLYVEQSSNVSPAYPAIAAAVSPPGVVLPRPTAYSSSP